MNFIYLQTFCEVARCGSLTRVAEALGYAQSSTELAVQQAVREGEFDIGLLLDQPFSHPDLYTLPACEVELVLAVKPDSRWSTLTSATVHDFENARLILTEQGCTYRGMLLKALEESHVPFRVKCEFGSMEAIK